MLEADFRSEYGVSLLSYYKGSMSLRELVVLTLELPPTARVPQELGRRTLGEVVRWSEATALMADIANGVRTLTYYNQIFIWQKGGGKGERPQIPVLIHEPGWVDPDAGPITATPTEAIGFFGLNVSG